jgi:hypothetical protein
VAQPAWEVECKLCTAQSKLRERAASGERYHATHANQPLQFCERQSEIGKPRRFPPLRVRRNLRLRPLNRMRAGPETRGWSLPSLRDVWDMRVHIRDTWQREQVALSTRGIVASTTGQQMPKLCARAADPPQVDIWHIRLPTSLCETDIYTSCYAFPFRCLAAPCTPEFRFELLKDVRL